MKLFKILNLIFLFILIIIAKNLFSQTPDEIHCGTINSNPSYPYWIPNLTMGENEKLRIAIIYVTFPDDNVDGYPYTIWPAPIHGQATRPYISLIDANKQPSNIPFMLRYNSYTLSDFFCQMSMGKYDVVGDEFAVILPHESQYYKDLKLEYGDINQIVL